MFDFNPATNSVYMQVAERHDVHRFRKCSVPTWFDVDIKPPNFPET